MTNTVILTKILSGSVDILNLCYAVTEVLYLGAEFLDVKVGFYSLAID